LITPYIVDRPLSDHDLFFGREPEFDRLNRYLSSGQRLLVLYGRHHIGKTSFLAQMPLRLATRYIIRVVDWADLAGEGEAPLWHVLVGVSRATGVATPSSQAYAAAPSSYTGNHLRIADESLAGRGEACLVCIDGIPGHALGADHDWLTATNALRAALAETSNLALLLVVEGSAEVVNRVSAFAGLPQVGLGPLQEQDAEELLTIPVRAAPSIMTMKPSAVYYSLSGGEPFFIQSFGQELYQPPAQVGLGGLAGGGTRHRAGGRGRRATIPRYLG
jgi:hypothetical protein